MYIELWFSICLMYLQFVFSILSLFASQITNTEIIKNVFTAYEKYRGPLGNVRKGVLVMSLATLIYSKAFPSLNFKFQFEETVNFHIFVMF